MAWALIDNWSLPFIMAVYLCQNLIFGVWWFQKMGSLTERYQLENLKMSMAQGCHYLFLVYFMCHAALFYWLTGEDIISMIKWPMFIMAGMFFLSQWFSFDKSRICAKNEIPTEITIMFPYVRFLPMVGLILIAKGIFAKEISVLVFLLLKTFIDVITDVAEHECFTNELCHDIFFSKNVIFSKDIIYSRYGNKKSKTCDFCGRMISKFESSCVIKKYIVCKQCSEKIEKEKKKL